ncbi:MAG: hypothetical protein H7A31_00850 [Thermotogae bacterium]|nr:hypothetical protein [Thermotogota bacterium]
MKKKSILFIFLIIIVLLLCVFFVYKKLNEDKNFYDFSDKILLKENWIENSSLRIGEKIDFNNDYNILNLEGNIVNLEEYSEDKIIIYPTFSSYSYMKIQLDLLNQLQQDFKNIKIIVFFEDVPNKKVTEELKKYKNIKIFQNTKKFLVNILKSKEYNELIYFLDKSEVKYIFPEEISFFNQDIKKLFNLFSDNSDLENSFGKIDHFDIGEKIINDDIFYNLSGEKVKFTDNNGKFTILSFVDKGCPPCIAVTDIMTKIIKKYGDKVNVKFVFDVYSDTFVKNIKDTYDFYGIDISKNIFENYNYDEYIKDIKEFIEEKNINEKNVFLSFDHEILYRMNIYGVPVTIILDNEGKVYDKTGYGLTEITEENKDKSVYNYFEQILSQNLSFE